MVGNLNTKHDEVAETLLPDVVPVSCDGRQNVLMETVLKTCIMQIRYLLEVSCVDMLVSRLRYTVQYSVNYVFKCILFISDTFLLSYYLLITI